MSNIVNQLSSVQNLVLEIQKIERNHTLPNTDTQENVALHSFSIAILAWKIHSLIDSKLSIEKILKYALVHDFLEKWLSKDINAFADEEERKIKIKNEEKVLKELQSNYNDFPDMIQMIEWYESMRDEEAQFVYIIDKMQAIILWKIDNWRPYKKINIRYEAFSAKIDSYLSKCPDELIWIYKEIINDAKITFYDQP